MIIIRCGPFLKRSFLQPKWLLNVITHNVREKDPKINLNNQRVQYFHIRPFIVYFVLIIWYCGIIIVYIYFAVVYINIIIVYTSMWAPMTFILSLCYYILSSCTLIYYHYVRFYIISCKCILSPCSFKESLFPLYILSL